MSDGDDTPQEPDGDFTATARLLHWAMAALIICQYVLGNAAEAADEAGNPLAQLALLANHKSVGMTVLALAVLRVGWRLVHPPPPLPPMPGWQTVASRVTHLSIYALIFALPVTGWLMSSASAYTVSWFNLFEFPDLIVPDADMEAVMKEVHHVLAPALFVLVVLHVLAALKHHFIDRDGVLMRMLTGASAGLFVALLASAVWALTQPARGAADNADPLAADPATAVSTQPAATPPPVKVPTDDGPSPDPARLWHVDYAASRVEFIGEQAGAAFSGTWTGWQAEIRFDPDNLAGSRATVTVDVAGVDTRDSDRDDTIRGSEWFDVASFPTAEFATDSIRASEVGYVADATLTIRDQSTPVQFAFDVTTGTDGNMTLDGSARLDRLALGLGSGDWQDTTWVGQYVDVNVHVEGRR